MFSPRGHCRRVCFRLPGLHASTFLSPFAPRPLRRFSARMGTVTPRQVSRPTEVSPLHVTRPSETILPPTTQLPPSPLLHATPQLDGSPLAGARLHQWFAGSPGTSGRIKFVLLRTGLSPPVAPHPASRRRSYLRLQAGERMPEEDFHLSERVRSRAHGPPASLPATYFSFSSYRLRLWNPPSTMSSSSAAALRA